MQKTLATLMLAIFAGVTFAALPTPISAQPGVQIPLSPQEMMALKTSDPARYQAALDAMPVPEPTGETDLAGGPDDDGYTWKDSDEPGGPTYSWDTYYSSYGSGDDNIYSYNFGWNFVYRGTAYTSIYMSTNGYIQFGYIGYDYYTTGTYPNSAFGQNEVGAFVVDQYADGSTGQMRFGTYGSAPNRKVVITWNNVRYYSYGGQLSYQIILNEADSSIVCQYASNSLGWQYVNTRQGMQNAAKTIGLNIVNSQVKSNYAIKYKMLSGTKGLWTGAVSSDWNNAGNWDFPAVPTPSMDVHIPAGVPNFPTTNSAIGGYVCKSLTVDVDAQMTVELAKVLDVGDIDNAGTIQADGNITCSGDFTNSGTFNTGLYGQFRFDGSAAANISGAGSFFDLFVEKTPLDVSVGTDPVAGGSYFGGGAYTLMAGNPSSVAGDISSWACYAYGSGSTRLRVYRANYNGYTWGMVVQGALQSHVYGYNEYTENLAGVQVGDRVAAYPGGWLAFAFNGGMLVCLADANPGSNNWYDWGYGPLALQAYIQAPAGDVTTAGEIVVANELNIADDNDLYVDGPVNLSVAGPWINNGAFHPGAGTVTFNGESQISGTGTHEFYNLDIPGILYAPSAMTVGGAWNCTGTFSHNNGLVTMTNGSITSGGQPFYNLTIDSPTDGDVTLLASATVDHNLTLTNGRFMVGANTLTLGTAASPATAVVNGPAVFSVVGTGPLARGVVTAFSDDFPYSFTVNQGAGIAALNARFTWFNTNGISIDGGTIDAVNNFSWTSFTSGDQNGAMLKIANNSQVINDITMTDFMATSGYNIDYSTNATGHLTVTDGGGGVWGEDFDNDPSNLVDWVVTTIHDVGVTAIVRPSGMVGEHILLYPSVTVMNYGEAAEEFDVRVIISDATDAELFNQVEHFTGLAVGASQTYTFTVNSWDPTPQGGPYHVIARTELVGDRYPENDMREQDFVVGPPYPMGWAALSPMPLSPAGKDPQSGGWLAFDEGSGLIFAAKGNKTSDFFSYDPNTDAWTTLTAWPLGMEAKAPKAGAQGTSDGAGKIYATKGNNTQGFWMYDAATSTWTPKKDVPLGTTNKKVKGGTDLVYVKGVSDGPDYVYLLKGYKNEYWRYDVAGDSWSALPNAPGAIVKWNKGSWLAYDGSQYIYAHKANYGEFYQFDIATGAWGPASLAPMPLIGGTGKSKKSKEGGAGTYLAPGMIYAFKGGNTTEFWKYNIGTGVWTEAETIPQTSTLYPKKKKVKAGSDLVTAGPILFGNKGNKAPQIWRYVPGALDLFVAAPPSRDGVMAEQLGSVAEGMSISPNPLANGFAVLRYGLPRAGAAEVSVLDVTGRSVLSKTLSVGRSGTATLDLRNLSNGVYLVKLSSEGFATSQKLVVQH